MTTEKNPPTDLHPRHWIDRFPKPGATAHKYDRGLLAIFAAPELTGATCLAATAALHSGVGLIRVIAPQRADVYRTILPPDIMVVETGTPETDNVTAWLAGPGGLSPQHKGLLPRLPGPVILDSSALPEPGQTLGPHYVLTPHGGEFRRVFPGQDPECSQDVIRAARQSQAIVTAKGPVTYIAHPDGRSVIQEAPNPALARGGTGDVLAGLIGGLAAQGMPAFEAACAAIWINGRAAQGQSHSFCASDLVQAIRSVIDRLAQGKID